MSTARPELLLRRLIVLAGDVRDLLAAGDWEAALPVQESFDESFATLQRLTETGSPLGREHINELAQLRHVHAENLSLAADLQRTAGAQRTKVGQVRRINTAYSPLGANHRPSPRYVDGSA